MTAADGVAKAKLKMRTQCSKCGHKGQAWIERSGLAGALAKLYADAISSSHQSGVDEGYRRGWEDMRERASKIAEIDGVCGKVIARAIRDIPAPAPSGEGKEGEQEQNVPIGRCKCGAPKYTDEGFCGACGAR